jgi:tetratricopeptide (TPR) repeat protein
MRMWLKRSGTSAVKLDAKSGGNDASTAPPTASRQSVVDKVRDLASSHRYADALAIIDASLLAEADAANLVSARASILFEWGRYHEARIWLAKAAELGVQSPSLFLQLGWTLLWTVDAPAAEMWMRKAVEADEAGWLGHFGLATSLRAQGRMPEAIENFERATRLADGMVHPLLNLGDCMLAAKQAVVAEDCARRALAIDPANGSAWINLGIALVAQDRFDESLAAFEAAHGVDNGADQHLNLAIALQESGRLEEALDLYEKRLPAHPSVVAHVHYAHALLTGGRLREGWHQYEFRWLQEPLLSLRPSFRKPVWSGQDLNGKTILLRAEQGIGDVIQFVRYAPQVKRLGATVLLETRNFIQELARGFPGIDRVLEPNETYPHFDYYIHLMSLPRVFGTELASIPATVPYLRPDSARMGKWENRLGTCDRPRVGLVWAGDPDHRRDRYRSIPFEMLAPLRDVEGIRIVSLQKGPQSARMRTEWSASTILELGPELHDFADTAAVIAQLDVLICVDTSVAHLAGALGKRVWLMLPTPADWRWMEHCSDCPWYPTMRLFRQQHRGSWAEVVDEVRRALVAWATRLRDDDHPARNGSTGTYEVDGRFIALTPRAERGDPRYSAVAETRVGILQYWPDQPFIGESINRYGEYLPRQNDVILKLLPADAKIVEIAAGVGLDAVHLATVIGPAGHLWLYEDNALYKQALQRNLDSNRLRNFTIMRRRAGDGSDIAGPGTKDQASLEREAETIDQLRLEALHLIKINEWRRALPILEGAQETLWRLRPSVFIATQDVAELPRLADSLRDFGYVAFQATTPLFNPENFNGCELDVFGGKTRSALLAVPEELELSYRMTQSVGLMRLE